eukprot:CAMPEP_0196149312 /NCGR_PEP_ID=MMETSP0910-20130528/29578_1 /TAXON_ID=49265 /ORGANISM="Thalassiosira rotula, Strain GSO102" /LENGTH=74 /DNA_ID=CAMNT_0041412199 /DNA_START=13 /DNA_END=234 /DNA_ORIENTATION=-
MAVLTIINGAASCAPTSVDVTVTVLPGATGCCCCWDELTMGGATIQEDVSSGKLSLQHSSDVRNTLNTPGVIDE